MPIQLLSNNIGRMPLFFLLFISALDFNDTFNFQCQNLKFVVKSVSYSQSVKEQLCHNVKDSCQLIGPLSYLVWLG